MQPQRSPTVAVGQNSVVYAENGAELGVIPAEHNRTPVAGAAISPWVREATVAIEDRRFYEHGGVEADRASSARSSRTCVQGRSCRADRRSRKELVRNLYLTRQRTLQRKLTEACLAIKLGQKWSKDRILTAYLNEVYYGNHAYGIEAAARDVLLRAGAAAHARPGRAPRGIAAGAVDLDPFVRPDDAIARRDEVLHAMLVNGDISAAVRRARADGNLRLRPGHRYTAIHEPYFFSYVEDLSSRSTARTPSARAV